MGDLLQGLRLAITVLGIWTLASVVAAVPLIGWLRVQAVANEVRTQKDRRRAWLSAVGRADLR